MTKNKDFSVIAVLLVIVAILAVGGVSYYANKNSNVSIAPGNVINNNFQKENQNKNELVNQNQTILPTRWAKQDQSMI